jgi:starch-binding outer membrane protein, SusD/RagB family
MKKIITQILVKNILVVLILISISCKDDVLNLLPTTQLASDAFWKTEDDAYSALMGAYASVRNVYNHDYFYDGWGEYHRTRGNRAQYYTGMSFNNHNYGGTHDNTYKHLYGAINHVNYVIENVTNKTLPNAPQASRSKLEEIIGEARLLRGMCYFKLITMWGDVPYIGRVIKENSEVANIKRTPLSHIKDSIMADFTYAYEKLPPQSNALGRAPRYAALAFRGKLQLYWACWNNFGWPELEGFTPNQNEARASYAGAAADFKSVIEDYGLTLFRNGEPGEIDELGKAEILPNYFYLFLPTANGDPEIIFAFTQGGVDTGQGEELMRDFGSRNHEYAQCWVYPRYEILDRYQSIITGDFCDPLIPMDPTNNPAARTTPNSAVNPQSFANRDYRMKSSVLWDYEMIIGLLSLKITGWVPFIYGSWNARVTINGETYYTYNTDDQNTGVVYRKFVRNYESGNHRSAGDYYFPIIRLADVFLMYAEATNEINGPQSDAVELVNRIRHRGNLPPLKSDKFASKEAFFDAIEQERIVELLGEGHRGFDIRRWRALERVYGPPYGEGRWMLDTWGRQRQRYFYNAPELSYEQCYLFRIPESERDRNPNLTQNKPWR